MSTPVLDEITTTTKSSIKEPKTRKRTKTKEVVKDIATIRITDPKKLSQKEMILAINDLRATATFNLTKIENLDQIAESSFNRARQAEADFTNMETYYKKKLNFINDQLIAFAGAVTQATKGGII